MKYVHTFLLFTCFRSLFAQSNPVPQIDLPLIPQAAQPGSAGFTLTVDGAGFVNGSVVSWNGSPRSTTFISPAKVTAAINASDVATAGTASVTVSNPTPGGGTSSGVYFEVTTPKPVTLAGIQLPALAGIGVAPIAVDLNNDHKLDLVLSFQDRVAVALGNGDGTFQPPIKIGGEDLGIGNFNGAGNLVIGDFNKDGKLDIASVGASIFPSSVFIFLGNGDGTFQTAIKTGSQSNTGYLRVAVGDFNQDGKLDIAATYFMSSGQGISDQGISILSGNGDGTFQLPINISTPQGGILLADDFDGDGVLDLLTYPTGLSGDSIATFLGNGDGTFQSPILSTSNPFIQNVSATDVNGDGSLDLLLWFVQDHPLEFDALPQFGDGTGAFPSLPTNLASGQAAFPPGDFDGNDRVDFVTGAAARVPPPPDALSLWAGNGDGTFADPVAIVTTTGLSVLPLVQGDFNNDGMMDLLARDQNGVAWMFLQGSFPAGTPSPNSLNFNSQAVGSSTEEILTLKNTGTATLTVSGVTVAGTDASEYGQTNTCFQVIAGAACQITVTFAPTTTGVKRATLNIYDNASDNPQTVALIGMGSDFSVDAASPTSATVSAGQTANYTLNISPVSGFNQAVTLSCSGAPTGATCTVPASVTLNGSTDTSVMVSVSTTPNSSALNSVGSSTFGALLACVLLPLPLIVNIDRTGAVRLRKHWRRRGLVLLSAVILMLIPACGGNGAGHNRGTPPGTYTLTVAATFTSDGAKLSHNTTFALVVR
jgi:Abnormal spindle-like microcephaly-assoc'd, ASPM-SPD-2-Hydin/FG-GAP-like repeat